MNKGRPQQRSLVEDTENIKLNQSELNIINAMKNTLDRINSKLVIQNNGSAIWKTGS